MGKTGSRLTNSKDAAVVAAACGGDQTAFLVLYDRYKAGVTMYVSKYILIREEVEDVVLESFQKAFSQIRSYNPEYRFSTWLYSIAYHTALDHIQKSGSMANTLAANSIDDVRTGLLNMPASTGNPEAEVIVSQEYEKLVTAIEGLPDLYREVAVMALLDNVCYEEISQKTELPLNTVKTRVRRAKACILKIMNSSEV